jgi:colanic acid/amylovoran biosynthesis glycosyltransferase
LKKLGCPNEKISIVQLGVNIKGKINSNRYKDENSLNLIQIASLREKKGHFYTLNAFMNALKECDNMSLTLIGNGDKKINNYITNFIKLNRLEKKIRFSSFIDYSKIHEFLSNFDVFIHPSCYSNDMDCEGGAPTVLLDAQLAGVPIISTLHCDIPLEVVDGETGILSNEKDIDLLTNSIIRFYKMENSEYNIFSKNARKHIENSFNIINNAKTLADVYKSILEAKSKNQNI